MFSMVSVIHMNLYTSCICMLLTLEAAMQHVANSLFLLTNNLTQTIDIRHCMQLSILLVMDVCIFAYRGKGGGRTPVWKK